MRIISGRFRGRRIKPPVNKWPTRPTTDIAKEGLFNILQNRIDFEDVIFLDLFGGTGNHCFEILSRGCTDATYVDKHIPALKFVADFAKELGVDDQIKIVRADVKKYISGCSLSFNYIFVDPPYALSWLENIPNMVLDHQLLQEGGILVIEHNHINDFRDHPRCVQVRNYGESTFSFFE